MQTYTKMIAVLSLLTTALSYNGATAATLPSAKTINVTQAMRRMAPHWGIANASASRVSVPEAMTPPVEQTPSTTIGPFEAIYDIDGPDGQLWYYTRELRSRANVVSEYLTEYILEEYTFDIYDSEFNLVGTIHDKMRYRDNEVRVPGPANGIDLLPVLTRNFFNNDDLYEVVVSLAVNTTTEGMNNYRSVVYSIGGETETVTLTRDGADVELTVDKPVASYDAFIADVLDASTDDQENYYITFMSEIGVRYDIDWDKLFEGDPAEQQKYWEAQSAGGSHYVTYAKADADGQLVKVFENKVTYQTVQGDMGDSAVPMFTLMHNGEAYIVTPHYEDTFFLPYYSVFDEMEMRLPNNFVVEMHRLNATSSEQVVSFKVPMTKGDRDVVAGTFYAVGDLRYRGDVLWDQNDNPSFIVSRYDYNSSADSNDNFCYYLYDSNGNLTSTIFENAERTMAMSSIDGYDEQQCFVLYDDVFDERYYCMVNLHEGYDKKKTVKIPANQGTYDDPDMLYFNLDRVQIGDTYKYAFEMRTPIEEDGNVWMRIAWFNADGSNDRIDYINMGPDIYYATAYIEGLTLDPYLIVDDETPEYILLLKRGIGVSSASQEEFLIARPRTDENPDGTVVLRLEPDPVKGYLNNLGIYPGMTEGTQGMLVRYLGENGYYGDFYALPFSLDPSSIVDIETADATSAIRYDGHTLSANGHIIVCDINGRCVASGNNTLTVDSLTKGIYIAVTGNAINKFIVK